MTIRDDANQIINNAIQESLPDTAVKEALQCMTLPEGNVYIVAIGKAAWQMGKTAHEVLGTRIKTGIVITKYDHAYGNLSGMDIYEAGHPIPDAKSFAATEKVIELVADLKKEDIVILLISGGGSSLFEKPLIAQEELEDITQQLLNCGANIVEINTIRKRLSAVKGGRFAKLCEPAQIKTIVLSDIVGDPLDMIASGPAYQDCSTSEEALEILDRYHIRVSDAVREIIKIETPKSVENVETYITGNVTKLCKTAKETAENLGYQAIILSDAITEEAKSVGQQLGLLAQEHNATKQSQAFIMGGETVVYITGQGKGGRNQEVALSAARSIQGLDNVAVFSVGSDGTDGPTDVAGGYCDGATVMQLEGQRINIEQELQDNNSYYALQHCDGLITTGPTGTNVNDLMVLLIKR